MTRNMQLALKAAIVIGLVIAALILIVRFSRPQQHPKLSVKDQLMAQTLRWLENPR